MTESPAVDLVLDAKALLGEGALWSVRDGLLFWIDIDAGLVHRYDPDTGTNRSLDVGQPVGTIVRRMKGGAMVALRDGFAALDLESGNLTFLADPEKHLAGNRFNDGKCDPAGRFWAGTLGRAPGALYRMDTDLSVRRMVGDVRCSNGIAWSLDKRTMYYIDTPTGYVEAWDYDDATGNIANRRVCIRIPEGNGSPDGCTLDADGNLWVAHWDGWNVTCYDPATGKPVRRIPLPVAKVTSVAFGGPGLDVLYITSAREGFPEGELRKQPLAGGLFACRPGVRGIPAPEFGG